MLLRALLPTTNGFVHPWRATNKYLIIPLPWLYENCLKELLSDISFYSPVGLFKFLVKYIKGLKALRVSVLKVLEFLFEDNFLLWGVYPLVRTTCSGIATSTYIFIAVAID